MADAIKGAHAAQACRSKGRRAGSSTGGGIGGDPSRNHRGAARHHSGPLSGDWGAAQDGKDEEPGEGCAGPTAAISVAARGDGAGQGASDTANIAGVGPAQEDVRRSSTGDGQENSDSNHGGNAVDSGSHSCAASTNGGRTPENGGKGGYAALLPARPYRDRDLVDTGMMQLAPNVPPEQWPALPKKVPVLGRSAEDAWVVASEALAMH